ncbi:YgiQ family radical SAM protein [Salinispirillum sp. LH 10-3-1]|uniref:YgiQ family radical SAM protein n=1 Tax=Salinispirillum sp. LH 10-3-1 TaxID=2952525 RepID=A0AB38YIC9_9GAMM
MSTTKPKPLYAYRKYWAECFGPAPFLPMSRAEMDALGWDSCDIILVTGDAYVDHPSFGMAVVGRVLEAQGFRVGIIAQPDWQSTADFKALGQPNLFFGVAAGNMDSMINRYTADRKVRSDDAYTPGGQGGSRPDRATIVYSQRVHEAWPTVPIVIGGIEASLRRLAHYDYWSDKVRQSILIDSHADLLLYGNAERAIVEIAHRAAQGERPRDMHDIRATCYVVNQLPDDFARIDSRTLDAPSKPYLPQNPYQVTETATCSDSKAKAARTGVTEQGVVQAEASGAEVVVAEPVRLLGAASASPTFIELPDSQAVRQDSVLYAHASRIFHRETNPGNARAVAQRHGDRWVWQNPPAIPLSTDELDWVFELPYQRIPHPVYGDAVIPAYDMIKFSVNIMRGCFGGCTFCSITEHEGRIIQSRSEDSVIQEIERIRDKTPGFTGAISDLGGPTANMYHLTCNDREIEAKCRRPSCVYPTICGNLITDHSPTTKLYRRARALPGIKQIRIASGLRYDLAVKDPEYVRELVTHHVGGYLKIAPEHTESGPLDLMMKPGMGAYDEFKEMFDRFSKEAGKEQYLIPYFIAAHPGSTDEDMMALAIWLKAHKFRVDQVQNFYPSPMATATAMFHTGKNPLKPLKLQREGKIYSARGKQQRLLHKAFLQYHRPENWPMLRQALKRMGRADLIGRGKTHLVPPEGVQKDRYAPRFNARTQHTGLPHNPSNPAKGKGARGKPASKRASKPH